MIEEFQSLDNSICATLPQDLYEYSKLAAITRLSQVRIPALTRVVGYRLLLAGQGKNFETDLKIKDIAAYESVSKSLVIRSLKLLVDLQIFHKEEYKNRPCVYRFNLDGEWLEYSTPEPREKVTPIRRAEGRGQRAEGEENSDLLPSALSTTRCAICLLPSSENEDEFQSVFETPQEEDVVNEMPLPFEERDVRETPQQKKPTIWRNPTDSSSVRYVEVGPIYDEPTGKEIQKRVDEDGVLPQQVVIEAVKLARGFRFLTAIAAVAGEICSRALDIILKPQKSKTPKGGKKRILNSVPNNRLQEREQRQEAWFRENRHLYGYGDGDSYNCLPLVNGERCIRIDGELPEVRKLMQTSEYSAYAM